VLTFLVSLQALLQWLVVLGLLFPIGFFLARLFDNGAMFFEARTAWLGLSALVTYLNLVHLVIPLSSHLVIGGVTLLSISAIAWHRTAVISEVKRVFVNQSSLQLKNRIIFSIGLLFLANLSLAPISNYDSGLYHLGLVRYLAHDPLIPGLANLHTRFGLGSSTYSIAAFFEGGLWGSDGYRLANGFVLLFLVFECSKRIRRFKTHDNILGDILIVLSTPLLLMLAIRDPWEYISSPSPDLTSAIVLIVAFAYSLDAFTSWTNTDMATAVIITSLAATFRPLNFLALIVIVLVAIFRFIKIPQSRNIAIFAGIPSALLLFSYVIHNFITTGYMFFPSDLAITHPKWQVPSDEAQALVEAIGMWARGGRPLFSTGWFMPVLNQSKQDFYPAVLILVATLLLVGLKFLPATSQQHENKRVAILGSLTIGGTFLVWFVGAPTPRFGFGVLYALAIFPLALLANAQIGDSKNSAKYVVLGMFIILVAQCAWIPLQHGTSMTMAAEKGNPHNLPILPTITFHQFITNSGLVVNLPDGESDQCYRTPLCTPYPIPKLHEITLLGRKGYSVK
jgi:hypothetical protein